MPKNKPEKRSHADVLGANDSQTQEQEGLPSTDSQPTIVLQIGSSTLTLGFATDPTPQSIPHVIAYRNLRQAPSISPVNGQEVGDQSLVLEYPWSFTADMESERDFALGQIRDTLASLREGCGIRNTEVNVREYLSHNSRVQPVVRESEELSLTDISAHPQCVIGNEVLYLPSNSGYTVFKPLRYGRLNTQQNSKNAPSNSSVLSMLEDLWTKAIEEYLQVERKDFKNHRVVLLVPDMVDRSLYKEFMNILLSRMEFAGALLHQESVCAAYCSGLASCCVVNVGDEVTYVSCVEEGVSNPNTRIVLRYGGSDITRLFYFLLQKTKFPYSKCTSKSRLDGVLIQQLKESVCHLDSTIWGVREYQFSVMSPIPGRLLDYDIKLSDEGIVAAMGVFFPRAFCLPSDSLLVFGQDPQGPDRGDVFDESLDPPTNVTAREGGGDECIRKLFDGVKGVEVGVPEVTRRLRDVGSGGVISLDQAIHLSICCAASEEMKGRLYSSILLVGGGLSFPGASKMLHSRLERNCPSQIPLSGDNLEVYSNVRELDSSHVSWKGGAVLSCLDTCHELWIEKQEWDFSGVRLLRERAPFIW